MCHVVVLLWKRQADVHLHLIKFITYEMYPICEYHCYTTCLYWEVYGGISLLYHLFVLGGLCIPIRPKNLFHIIIAGGISLICTPPNIHHSPMHYRVTTNHTAVRLRRPSFLHLLTQDVLHKHCTVICS